MCCHNFVKGEPAHAHRKDIQNVKSLFQVDLHKETASCQLQNIIINTWYC